MVQFIHHPAGSTRLGDILNDQLSRSDWTHFRAAVAFAKQSGVQHVREALAGFARRATVQLSVGIHLGGTSIEALNSLLDALGPLGELWVCHNARGHTFHPKLYLFKNTEQAVVIASSGNLTQGGLYTNYEASLASELDLATPADRHCLREIEDVLDQWSSAAAGTAQQLTGALLAQLEAAHYLGPEAETPEIDEEPLPGTGQAQRA